MNVGELKERLSELPDDLPVLIGDEFDEHAWDWLGWVGQATTPRRQRLTRDGEVVPAGAVVVRLGSDAP